MTSVPPLFKFFRSGFHGKPGGVPGNFLVEDAVAAVAVNGLVAAQHFDAGVVRG